MTLVNLRYIVTCVTSTSSTTAEYMAEFAYKTMQKGDSLLHDHSYFDMNVPAYLCTTTQLDQGVRVISREKFQTLSPLLMPMKRSQQKMVC